MTAADLSQRPVPITARKIWDVENIIAADGPFPGEQPDLRGEIHPDLIRYKDHWYCGLKETGHSRLGRMRLIRSRDGKTWESVRLFQWADGGQVGDAKFSVTAEGALMITTWAKDPRPTPGSPPGAKSPTWTSSVTWLSHNGLDWGTVHACPTGFDKVVRYLTTWHHGAGYCVDATRGTLFKTLDGKNWASMVDDIFSTWNVPAASEELMRCVDPHDIHQAHGEAPRRPNETALAFRPEDNTAIAIARTHPFYAIIGTAPAPAYSDWTWKPARVDWDGDGRVLPAVEKLGVQMGGPVLKYLGNGLLLAGGRADASTPGNPKGRLTLFLVDPEAGILQRWGDFDGFSHYPGIVEYEGQLWITCGKQQGMDPFEVYLLNVPTPEAP